MYPIVRTRTLTRAHARRGCGESLHRRRVGSMRLITQLSSLVDGRQTDPAERAHFHGNYRRRSQRSEGNWKRSQLWPTVYSLSSRERVTSDVGEKPRVFSRKTELNSANERSSRREDSFRDRIIIAGWFEIILAVFWRFHPSYLHALSREPNRAVICVSTFICDKER